jgi:hypothetical protein
MCWGLFGGVAAITKGPVPGGDAACGNAHSGKAGQVVGAGTLRVEIGNRVGFLSEIRI